VREHAIDLAIRTLGHLKHLSECRRVSYIGAAHVRGIASSAYKSHRNRNEASHGHILMWLGSQVEVTFVSFSYNALPGPVLTLAIFQTLLVETDCVRKTCEHSLRHFLSGVLFFTPQCLTAGLSSRWEARVLPKSFVARRVRSRSAVDCWD
jgi:hypothetical protein